MFDFTEVLKTGVRWCSSGYTGLLIAHAVTGLIFNVFCLELARKTIKNRRTSKPQFSACLQHNSNGRLASEESERRKRMARSNARWEVTIQQVLF